MCGRRGLDEAPVLAALAMRSKSHWGYDEEFMARVAPALRVEEEGLRRWPAFVVETDAGVTGFYRLAPVDGQPSMTDLWIEPRHIGAGFGRLLWEHAVARARDLSWTHVTIVADPNAEPFYVHCGARRSRRGKRRSGPDDPAVARGCPARTASFPSAVPFHRGRAMI